MLIQYLSNVNRAWSIDSALALALIAVISSLFTALLEIAWIWAYHAVSEILSIYFTLDRRVPPAWKILGLGLLIAVGAGGRQGCAQTRQTLTPARSDRACGRVPLTVEMRFA
jgi:hypothetical protein